MATEGSNRLEASKWERFKTCELNSGDIIFNSRRDAIVFKPKCDIWFLGWGQFASSQQKNMKFKYQWHIDDDVSEWHEIELTEGEQDTKKKWFDIDIRD